MVKLAESIGRLVMAGRDFTRLAAYTTRVTQLMHSIEKLVNFQQSCDLFKTYLLLQQSFRE
jgi:ABC-type uncharacterized transport system fused permease/ATPase subunit